MTSLDGGSPIHLLRRCTVGSSVCHGSAARRRLFVESCFYVRAHVQCQYPSSILISFTNTLMMARTSLLRALPQALDHVDTFQVTLHCVPFSLCCVHLIFLLGCMGIVVIICCYDALCGAARCGVVLYCVVRCRLAFVFVCLRATCRGAQYVMFLPTPRPHAVLAAGALASLLGAQRSSSQSRNCGSYSQQESAPIAVHIAPPGIAFSATQSLYFVFCLCGCLCLYLRLYLILFSLVLSSRSLFKSCLLLCPVFCLWCDDSCLLLHYPKVTILLSEVDVAVCAQQKERQGRERCHFARQPERLSCFKSEDKLKLSMALWLEPHSGAVLRLCDCGFPGQACKQVQHDIGKCTCGVFRASLPCRRLLCHPWLQLTC